MKNPQNTTQNIVPPNKDLEALKQHFPHCFDKNGDFDFEKFKKELAAKEVNFSKESYGMDWLGKSYARLLATDSAKTLIKEDTEWNSKEENKNSENLLIKGDNLEVLKHLVNAYHEKVKMIYIDPPYNTGSDDFVYEDDRTFTVAQLSELARIDEDDAKRILTFVNSKSNSHSAWLTFMYPRLYIAKQLLKDDGVIFVSIDDNEVAQLRILMNEILGEENFIGELIHQRAKGGGQASDIVKGHDYIIVFTKNFKKMLPLSREKIVQNKIIEKEGIKYIYNDDVVRKKFGKYDRENGDRRCFYEELITYKNEKQIKGIQEKIDTGEYFLEKNDQGLHVICKLEPLNKASSKLYSIINSDDTIKVLSEKGKRDLENLAIPIFTYPKPVELLVFLINSVADNDIILDFFAGSGTTGDAVMQLNAEDKANGKEGNRKYILVQLPEPIDAKKNKTAFNFVKNELKSKKPTIFEITKERLIRASKKIGDTSDFKIFETQPIWEDYEFEAKEFDKKLKFINENKLSTKDLQTLLITWKTYDNIPLTENLATVDLDGYIGHYGKKKLYLMDKGFKTKNLKALLNKIDTETTFEPVNIIVFGYHFQSKTLREIAENLSSYTNKKKLDIDFTTRY